MQQPQPDAAVGLPMMTGVQTLCLDDTEVNMLVTKARLLLDRCKIAAALESVDAILADDESNAILPTPS